ncbi:S-adenosyl-L-methionine-dependent methyltransferase [Phlegmacium glaucopus]|nr:S-adenosyl-L-methionine-dependent methyltransferase [Phlegmacium glaucopus]
MFPPSTTQSGDASIRATDNDAATARLSATQKQYLHDPFVKFLVPRAHLLPPRPPLINVGTYVRSAGIDTLPRHCQIVSLGSGSDTRFWRIAAQITTKKAMAIRRHKELISSLGDSSRVSLAQGGTALHSQRYHLLPADLRLPPSEVLEPMFSSSIEAAAQSSILDPSLPTLLLFECVLAYISPSASSRLLDWFIKFIQRSPTGVLGCVVYEMFVTSRFLNVGFTAARSLTLKEIRRAYIETSELERISKLEFLDEIEELDLILVHYAMSWELFLETSSTTWGAWGLTRKRE